MVSELFAQYPELKRLQRRIQRSKGAFSLFFVECNLPRLRLELAESLSEPSDVEVVQVTLPALNNSPIQFDQFITEHIKDASAESSIFLLGLENWLPTQAVNDSLSTDVLNQSILQLNWRRSGFVRIKRPLVIWLPKYALDLLAEYTPDFYDWNSGVFIVKAQENIYNLELADSLQALDVNKQVDATNYLSKKDTQKWLQTLTALLNEKKQVDHESINLLSKIGSLYKKLGDYKAALDYFQKALVIIEKIDNKIGKAIVLNNISQIYHAQGDYNIALEYLNHTLALQKEIDDKSGEGATLNNISQIYHAKGDYNTALEYLKYALAIRQTVGDELGEGVTLNNISQVYFAQGDYANAKKLLKQSLVIWKKIGDKSAEGTVLNNIALIYSTEEDYTTALYYLKSSLVISQEIGDKSGEGVTLSNIAEIYSAQGDYSTALECFKESLVISREIGNKLGEGVVLNNISQIYNAKGDCKIALEYLKKSLATLQEIGDKSGECTTMHNMAHLYWKTNKQELAFSYWIKAYIIAKQIEHYKVLQALDSMANQLGLDDGLASWEAFANNENNIKIFLANRKASKLKAKKC